MKNHPLNYPALEVRVVSSPPWVCLKSIDFNSAVLTVTESLKIICEFCRKKKERALHHVYCQATKLSNTERNQREIIEKLRREVAAYDNVAKVQQDKI